MKCQRYPSIYLQTSHGYTQGFLVPVESVLVLSTSPRVGSFFLKD